MPAPSTVANGPLTGGPSERSGIQEKQTVATRTDRAGEGVIDDHAQLSTAADATLAARAIDGDIQSFEVLARRHGPLMRVYSAKLLGSDIESDDVVQEAFLTGWRQISELDSPAHIRNWLMRIVTRKAIDRIRVRREHDDIDDWDPPAPAATNPERIVETRLQLDAVSEALDRLPADQRRCWLLRETAGYSYQEIADALELPIPTVRGLLARARRYVLHEMEAWR
ncbi:sigma-70 family RNA polymerase sigma factor [Frondihabitans sp. 4ASC-45]|uniref:RNA polymerase sigma factor n=2 Tax=unclassified Frondihabitans TaxID=2626248 RepID=UPI003C298DAC